MTNFRTPSLEELYALEQAARRERSRITVALAKEGVRKVRQALVKAFTKPYAPVRPKVMRHA